MPDIPEILAKERVIGNEAVKPFKGIGYLLAIFKSAFLEPAAFDSSTRTIK